LHKVLINEFEQNTRRANNEKTIGTHHE